MLAVISAPRKAFIAICTKSDGCEDSYGKDWRSDWSRRQDDPTDYRSTGATVDVEDDGSVLISGTDADSVAKAVAWVEGLTKEVHGRRRI